MLRVSRQNNEVPKLKRVIWLVIVNFMILLGCFFITIVSVSTTDQERVEGLIASFSNGIGIAKGSTSIEEGSLISGGVTQLEELKATYQNSGIIK